MNPSFDTKDSIFNMRLRTIEQDRRFQAAMRAELQELAAERGLRLAPRPAAAKAAAQGSGKPRDVIFVQNAPPPEAPMPDMQPMTDSQRIMKEVCAKHEVTKAELIGRQRSAKIAYARHEAAYRLKKETTLSLPQIGRRLGGRDHTTVLHSVRRHMQIMAEAAQQ